MQSNYEQMARLHQALVTAFPRVPDLQMLLSYGLDVALEEISECRSVTDAAFDAIRWAEAHGRLGELVRAAMRENPVNVQLRVSAEELRPIVEQSDSPNSPLDPELLARWRDAG